MSLADLEGAQNRRALADTGEPTLRDYWALLKPRVMSLVIFTACVGLVAAPTTPHPIIALASILCVAIGAGASGALNMWWDADIDQVMERTKRRPVPAGRVSPGEAKAFGLGLSVVSVALLALFANPLAGALLGFTIFYYVVIYSMWLKRRTSQNIVIGGAAGAFPPVIGWVIATGSFSIEPLLMFGLIFLWTPPHSWALALFRNEDYGRAGVPMLPTAAGERVARRWIRIYAVLVLAPVAALAFSPIGGVIYGAVAAVSSAWFLIGAWRVGGRAAEVAQADRYLAEKRFFGVSIIYLFLLFAALLAEAGLRGL
ncbi:MAG: heme o synthase [Neomegalonema sp.]|nr:heme o synthase [Neomegalonema sp.]